VHPIERLRFVARSRGAPAEVLVAESAAALVAFRGDPAGMVAACRRIVDRQLEFDEARSAVEAAARGLRLPTRALGQVAGVLSAA